MLALRSFQEVLVVLGGPARLGRLTRTNASCVCNWRSKRARFPSKFYDAMSRELFRLGYTAPAELWGQEELDDVDDQAA